LDVGRHHRHTPGQQSTALTQEIVGGHDPIIARPASPYLRRNNETAETKASDAIKGETMRRKIFTLLFALALIAPVVAQQEQQRPQLMIPGIPEKPGPHDYILLWPVEQQRPQWMFSRIPEKPGRLDYIREYTRAMRALVAGGEDPDVVRQWFVRQKVDKFGAMVMFLTTWDDAKIEQNRTILLDPLLEEAKKIRRPADR